MNTVCKFRCGSVKTFDPNGTLREYEFFAQYDESIPEDRRFAKATPTGHVTLTVNNPDVEFVVGQSYYFTTFEVPL